MPAEIPYYMPYLRPAEYEEYLKQQIELKYPYVPAPETYAEQLKAAQVKVAEREAAAAKPFPWKWVIGGGIALLVVYALVKKK